MSPPPYSPLFNCYEEGEDASVTAPPSEAPIRSDVGCRFYRRVLLQPWRTQEDVVDGFDWSLPPGILP